MLHLARPTKVDSLYFVDKKIEDSLKRTTIDSELNKRADSWIFHRPLYIYMRVYKTCDKHNLYLSHLVWMLYQPYNRKIAVWIHPSEFRLQSQIHKLSESWMFMDKYFRFSSLARDYCLSMLVVSTEKHLLMYACFIPLLLKCVYTKWKRDFMWTFEERERKLLFERAFWLLLHKMFCKQKKSWEYFKTLFLFFE